MRCKLGYGECDGCGICSENARMSCPICGKELLPDEKVYRADGEVIGCEFCVHVVIAETVLGGISV